MKTPKTENSLPRLSEDERIYLKVPYMARGYARVCHCGFDSEKKLWFTGAYNSNIDTLIEIYGVDEHTSDNARHLLETALETPDREELMARLQNYYEEKKHDESQFV